MTRYDGWLLFLQYALVMSLCANGLLAAALCVVAWMYPNSNKAWLPRRLREPPKRWM